MGFFTDCLRTTVCCCCPDPDKDTAKECIDLIIQRARFLGPQFDDFKNGMTQYTQAWGPISTFWEASDARSQLAKMLKKAFRGVSFFDMQYTDYVKHSIAEQIISDLLKIDYKQPVFNDFNSPVFANNFPADKLQAYKDEFFGAISQHAQNEGEKKALSEKFEKTIIDTVKRLSVKTLANKAVMDYAQIKSAQNNLKAKQFDAAAKAINVGVPSAYSEQKLELEPSLYFFSTSSSSGSTPSAPLASLLRKM